MILLRLIVLFILCSCNTISNLSKMYNNHNIVYNTNNISLLQNRQATNNVYFKISNFSMSDEFFLEQYFLEHIKLNEKYNILSSPNNADIIVEIKIMTILPIDEKTVEKISKYWLYINATQSIIVDSPDKLEANTTFLIDDSEVLLATGKGKHDLKGSHDNVSRSTKKGNRLFDQFGNDVLPGAVLGASIMALFNFSPAAIGIATVTGAGLGMITQELTSFEYNIAIVNITIKEKIKNISNNVVSKYKNVFSLSQSVIAEIYMDNITKNQPVIFNHETKLFVLAGHMKIFPNKINNITAATVVRVVSEILN